MPVLVLLFLVVPFAELAVILKVGAEVGVVNTVALLVVISAVGGWLVKREGLSVWRQAQARIDAGAVPGRELVDGVLILGAGALLLTPGFLSDCVGILVLLPPVRAALRAYAVRRLSQRVGPRW